MREAVMRLLYPSYYVFLEKVNNIVHHFFLNIQARNPHYASQFDWINIEQVFLLDLKGSLPHGGARASTSLYDFIIQADDEKLSKVVDLLVRIFEWKFIEQSRIPTDFDQIQIDFQLILNAFANPANPTSLSEFFHLLGAITNLNPHFLEKWVPIFSLRHAPATTLPLLFARSRVMPPDFFDKQLRHAYLLGDLVSEYLSDKIIGAFTSQHWLRTELWVGEDNVLCLRQPYLSDLHPLFSLQGRLSKQITDEEKMQLFESLSMPEKEQLSTILVYALLIGDYDVHPENIVYSHGKLLKIDNQWAFENLVTQRPMVVTDPLNPFRNRRRATPANHFNDYTPLIDDPCFILAIRTLIDHYDRVSVQNALASGLRDLVSVIEIKKPLSREKESISSGDMIMSLAERAGISRNQLEPNSQALSLNTIQEFMISALEFRIDSLRLLADALDLQHHLSDTSPNTRAHHKLTQLKIEQFNQNLETYFPNQQMVPLPVRLLLLELHARIAGERLVEHPAPIWRSSRPL